MSVITSSPMADVAVHEAKELVLAATGAGARARVLGGVGVALRCPSARDPALLAREYSDIDLVTDRGSASALSQALEALGYGPERRFNAMHGHSRMMFDRSDGRHLDVFVDQFVMCHRLTLADRLELHETTLPLADLLLTKLQVAELNAKDVTDTAALLLDHELTDDEAGINLQRITGLLSRDWGWWRTVSQNLTVLPSHLAECLSQQSRGVVTGRIDRLLGAIERAPKGLRWKARAKAGDRIAWRDDPEESH